MPFLLWVFFSLFKLFAVVFNYIFSGKKNWVDLPSRHTFVITYVHYSQIFIVRMSAYMSKGLLLYAKKEHGFLYKKVTVSVYLRVLLLFTIQSTKNLKFFFFLIIGIYKDNFDQQNFFCYFIFINYGKILHVRIPLLNCRLQMFGSINLIIHNDLILIDKHVLEHVYITGTY